MLTPVTVISLLHDDSITKVGRLVDVTSLKSLGAPCRLVGFCGGMQQVLSSSPLQKFCGKTQGLAMDQLRGTCGLSTLYRCWSRHQSAPRQATLSAGNHPKSGDPYCSFPIRGGDFFERGPSWYMEFWKKRFSEAPITQFCTTIVADIKKDGIPLTEKEYYLLSDVHDEDKDIRQKLQAEFLENALAQQKLEREDTQYSHGCLFCRQVIEPTRAEYLIHLSSQHNLQLGKPDNLVYVDDLISNLEQKLENLQCIFCEKFFKDRNVLKEHMRKKMHKRINPDNEMYDRFYIINYKGPNKTWKHDRKRRDSAEDEPCDWSDWQETLTLSIVCLFCDKSFSSWENVLSHMLLEHEFNYELNTLKMDFYEQVKLVNFIRRQLYRNRCINCDSEFHDRIETLKHMTSQNHITMPTKQLWNQPEYYFPTYENDAFLCQIEDNINDNKEELDSDLSDALSEINLLTTQEQANG